jgi:hypothetical protein
MFEITLMPSGIVCVRSDADDRVSRAFKRVQEYYENPVMAGRLDITRKDIDAWWADISETPYEEYWGGFNIPGSVWKSFQENYPEKNMSLIEKVLFLEVRIRCLEPSYVIGVNGLGLNDGQVEELLNHELSHALFSVNSDYREAALALIASSEPEVLDVLVPVRSDLIAMGYGSEVLDDEIVAYLATGGIEMVSNNEEYRHILEPLSAQLAELFQKTIS